MKKSIKIALAMYCCLPLCSFAQKAEKSISIQVSNEWNKAKENEPVVLKITDLKAGFTVKSAVVWDGKTEVPSQLDDLNGDRKADELAFVTNVPAKGNKTFKIVLFSEKSTKTYPSKVYADMLVSDKKGQHVPISSVSVPGGILYNQLHHHGPAFESELVAYRIYFDKKQTVDLYGKFHKGFELKESQFYPTDAQLAKGFGDDVLRVNASCGLGTLKGWNGKMATHIDPVSNRTESILAYGPVRTVVDVIANDWQYQGSELNMTTRYILYAGHRDAEVKIIFDETLKNKVFSTGVQDIKDSKSFSDHKGLVACWGTDWPVNDTIKYAKETVGLATCIPQKYVKAEAKDKDNYLYTVAADGRKSFEYNIVFTSMKETFGYKTPEAWFAYVQEWKKKLEHPCKVTIK
jgi:hypothetical protein